MQKIGFSSWSGGKDGCLALFRAEKMGIKIPYLFTMIEEGGERSRSHGLRLELLRAQADALGKTWEFRKATWGDYETEFLGYLHEKQAQGIRVGIFGDIDLDAHRGWVERVCQMENLQARLPLWQEARRDLIREFIREGFIARIVTIDTRKVPERYLGKIFTEELIEEFEAMGVDACGENGEFHTVVLDGPNFLHPIEVEVGEAIAIASYRQLDLKIKARNESLE
ncbi:diphthine--ammonia ligase [Gottschalkiaceae bacterium SANA]|nr:diphthine--ammonia ligase [Gottschalkiaceae bacterium SANA]